MSAAICRSCDAAFLLSRRWPGRLAEVLAEGLVEDPDVPAEVICPECANSDHDLAWLRKWQVAE